MQDDAIARPGIDLTNKERELHPKIAAFLPKNPIGDSSSVETNREGYPIIQSEAATGRRGGSGAKSGARDGQGGAEAEGGREGHSSFERSHRGEGGHGQLSHRGEGGHREEQESRRRGDHCHIFLLPPQLCHLLLHLDDPSLPARDLERGGVELGAEARIDLRRRAGGDGANLHGRAWEVGAEGPRECRRLGRRRAARRRGLPAGRLRRGRRFRRWCRGVEGEAEKQRR